MISTAAQFALTVIFEVRVYLVLGVLVLSITSAVTTAVPGISAVTVHLYFPRGSILITSESELVQETE